MICTAQVHFTCILYAKNHHKQSQKTNKEKYFNSLSQKILFSNVCIKLIRQRPATENVPRTSTYCSEQKEIQSLK